MKEFFSEEELRAATQKVRDAKLSTIPEILENPVVSAEFKENISHLYKKEKRIRLIRMVRKSVAAAVLVVVLGTSVLLSVSSEARASIISWFKNQSKIYTVFSFEGESGREVPVYEPSWIPESFEYTKTEEIMVDTSRDEDGNLNGRVLNRRLIYTCRDDNTRELSLRYGAMQEGDVIQLRMDDAEYETERVNINGVYGEVYISQDEQVSSGMVWFDEEHQVYFCLIGHLTREEMIKMAESVSIAE